MCYSATASFVASAALAGTGLAISRLPKEKSHLPLSFIPAVFAAHQFLEGMIWLNQGKAEADATHSAAVVAYALIAYVLWPVFIPFAAYLVEKSKKRRILILICQAVGLGVGLTFLLSIIRNPVAVSVEACSLSYSVHAPVNLLAPYLIAVSVPFLVSSQRGLILFGTAVLAACAAALYFASQPAFPSVWCFFAALLSAYLYVYFRASVPERAPQREVRLHT